MGTPGPDLIRGTDGDDDINGRGGNDTIFGLGGNDILDGWAGADAMDGGAGDDTYFVDDTGDTVTERLAGAAGGLDLVRSSVDFTLGANLENLRLHGAAINGIGNGLDNVLTGNGQGNVLNGRGGDDTLYGLGGNDSLDGWAGLDTMDGGAGDDTYFVDNAGDVVVETLAGSAGGVDLVRASVDFALGDNVENLRLYGSALRGTGNELGNVITGNGQGNHLVGLGGDDVIDGGAGDDTVYGWDGIGGGVGWDWSLSDDGQDVYRGGAGVDTYVVPMWLQSSWEGTSYTSISVRADLIAGSVRYVGFVGDRLEGFENIRTGDDADTVFGTDGANFIDVGGGGNIVYGRGGNDRLESGRSFDYFVGEPETTVFDRLDGGAGNDAIISGGAYWEYYDARSSHIGAATDLLFGRAGNDRLVGGLGNVVMTGGSGADTFDTRADTLVHQDYMTGPYDATASSVVITDFDPDEGDRIILNVGINAWLFDGNRKGEIPDFVGAAQQPGIDEVGYRAVANPDGSRDTVITYRYEFLTDFGYRSGEESGWAETLDFRIVLENYEGRVAADWITLA